MVDFDLKNKLEYYKSHPSELPNYTDELAKTIHRLTDGDVEDLVTLKNNMFLTLQGLIHDCVFFIE